MRHTFFSIAGGLRLEGLTKSLLAGLLFLMEEFEEAGKHCGDSLAALYPVFPTFGRNKPNLNSNVNLCA